MKSNRIIIATLCVVLIIAAVRGDLSGRTRASTTTTAGSGRTTTTVRQTSTTTVRTGTTTTVRQSTTGERTAADIRAMWQRYKPTYTGSPYATTPSWRSPYAAGKLADGFLKDGLNAMNFARYLARIPYDVELSDDLCKLAQYGAVISAANNDIDHQPPRPSGMPNDFYEMAKKSCGSSNLGWGYANIHASIWSYMQDEDTGNMDRVGHRRWIINPPLRYTGFGFANEMTAAQVFDSSRTPAFDYDYVCWPSWGEFPVDFFHSVDPWSISLNPSKYQEPKISSVTVTITRLSDNKVWTLNQSDNNPSESREYFNINNVGYGIKYCIIFRPDTSVRYDNGSAFRVKITGVKNSSGTAVTIEYEVKFFTM